MTVSDPGHYRGVFRTTNIPPCVVSVSDLRRLYDNLSENASDALERHIARIQRPEGQTEEKWEALKQQVREIGGVTVFVIGANGEQVSANSASALDDSQLPDRINSITFDSSNSLQNNNIIPLNRFRLVLDFTEPPGFGTYNPWDKPTPNGSLLEVIGVDSTWATGVYESVLGFFRMRGKRRRWFHTPAAFNLLNWLIGFPGALWIVYRIDGQFPGIFAQMHGALRGAIYVYIVLVVLLIFRLIIAGFRWTFPIVELEGSRSKSVRRILNLVLGSLLLALAYDVLKTVL